MYWFARTVEPLGFGLVSFKNHAMYGINWLNRPKSFLLIHTQNRQKLIFKKANRCEYNDNYLIETIAMIMFEILWHEENVLLIIF